MTANVLSDVYLLSHAVRFIFNGADLPGTLTDTRPISIEAFSDFYKGDFPLARSRQLKEQGKKGAGEESGVCERVRATFARRILLTRPAGQR